MMRYAIFFLMTCALTLQAQEKYWIYFRDKGSSRTSVLSKSAASQKAQARALGISEESMKRRLLRSAAPGAANGGSGLLDEADLPVAPEYIEALKRQGITPLVESRWLNAVSVRLNETQRASVRLLPSVSRLERVERYRGDSLTPGAASDVLLQKSPGVRSGQAVLDYGPSLAQSAQINVPMLHELDITGRGVIVGMLDTGFRWKLHESLKNLHVIAERDFIQNDNVTANQAGDAANQDEHGTMTMSTLGGYMPGQLIGPAFGASFLLGKTEYVPQELNSEEDHWVAGLEWLERSGAEVVSSSLGYNEFDAGQRSYTYQDMNGRTAVTTKAAAVAARKGVVVCVSMGNEGNKSWHYLTSPADADSIISVGAVTAQGDVAGFSSVGPTSDGRIKPDISTRGVADICAQTSSTSQSSYTAANGTSLATPLAAGAAALLLSARPELTPIEVRDYLRQTASNAASPNNSIGWGIIDAYKALMAKGLLISAQLSSQANADSSTTISVHILSTSALVPDSLRYYYSTDTGRTFQSGVLTRSSLLPESVPASGGIYRFTLPRTATHFYVSARDESGASRTLPAGAPGILYDSKMQPGRLTAPLPESFVLLQNFPNPFNARTTIRYGLTHPTRVSVTVYDILGRRMAQLVDEEKPAGFYSAVWDASAVSSGIYFYSIRTPEFSETRKMVLVR